VDYRVDFGIENGTEFDTIFCGTSHLAVIGMG